MRDSEFDLSIWSTLQAYLLLFGLESMSTFQRSTPSNTLELLCNRFRSMQRCFKTSIATDHTIITG
jgi:hypothetical protein